MVNGRILVSDVVLPRPGRYRALVNDTPAIANVISGELLSPGEGRLVVRFLARQRGRVAGRSLTSRLSQIWA